MTIVNILKAMLLGIIEGFTEWLPISSTAHMMIVNDFIHLDVSEEFMDIFLTVIQFGAVFALILMYFRMLNPFSRRKRPEQKAATWRLWIKIVCACIPAAILGFLLDDWIEEKMYNAFVVAVMLILYGILFIVFERTNKYKQPVYTRIGQISYQTAFYIGLFQVLALIPGTSRSGATILGAMLLGCSREISAEFSFFLAIPVILGAGFLRIIKYTGTVAGPEIGYLAVGVVCAFIVSAFSVKFLIGWIKKNSFAAFGYYRIVLGILMLVWYILSLLLK